MSGDDVVVLVNTPERLDLNLPHGRVTLTRNRDGTVLADVKPRAHRESCLLLPLEALARVEAWLALPHTGTIEPEFTTAAQLKDEAASGAGTPDAHMHRARRRAS